MDIIILHTLGLHLVRPYFASFQFAQITATEKDTDNNIALFSFRPVYFLWKTIFHEKYFLV